MTKPSKMKNKKVVVDGIRFDSKMESRYYLKLKEYVKIGLVLSFELQPVFVVQDKFKHATEGNIRAINYKADFDVTYLDGKRVIIDVKGQPTPLAKNTRKMFLKRYPDLNLKWITESKKWGTDGWICWFKLDKIRKANRKKKGKN